MPADQSPEFKKAVEDSKKLTAKPDNDELLQLYGLYKQGTQDPPFDQTEKPGMFDLKGKAKYTAWKAVFDKGTTAEDAQAEYVELVEKLKEIHGYDPSKVPEAVGKA
ncbi:MAG: hypothetical protein M1824_003275 [Vezdaea acicularis]|nr:MAG: hypothetical protein M1824_003275 [Vezdaea acicularis]